MRVVLVALLSASLSAQGGRAVHVELAYGAPGSGPAPNFSPKGTQVPLADVPAAAPLPPGAVRPARSGVMQIGPDKTAWMPILLAADEAHPRDLCRLYLDRNRNGSFADDGAAVTAAPSQNEKTKAWWSSFPKTEILVPYAGSAVERYLVTFWAVRDGEEAPGVVRYSVASWRTGKASVGGVEALVAVMDSNNDAIFDKSDTWSVVGADEPDAAKRVLSIAEARPTSRLMFVTAGGRDLPLEFRGMSPDGRSIDFAVVDRPITKKADRAPDDTLAAERVRPRASTPFAWRHGGLDGALKEARATKRRVLVDFETTWCGPCKTMDEWIWNDADVVAQLNAGYIGVKLDGDVEKALVTRYDVAGYPTGLVLDAGGAVVKRFVGYQSSKEVLQWLVQGGQQAPVEIRPGPGGGW
jgi:thiol-disulfide isomerase/thioredoxin